MKAWLACSSLLVPSLTACAAPPSDELAGARAEIAPLFEAMQAAANEHDAERHVWFHARDPTPRYSRFGISALWQERPEGWRLMYAHESSVSQ